MTLNHAIFSLSIIVWILYAVAYWEEPKLLEEFPDEYAEYKKKVPSIIPFGCPFFTKRSIKKD